MKIGIITILKVNNYGAELQAYATQAVLKKLGYEAEIIDYLFYKNPQHKRTKNAEPVFLFPFSSKVKEFLYPKIFSIKSLLNRNIQSLREKRFQDFHKENTSLSPTYYSIEELYSAKMDYDVYMVGSDQVWNPGVYSSLNPYFLTFAPAGRKRISYASSFGVSQIPDYAIPYYREKLRDFDSIGVREKDAVSLVETLSGKKAEWVLDPTLLLAKTEWLQIAKPLSVDIEDNYILLYELTLCPYIRQLADYFRKATGWQIIRICQSASRVDKEERIINIRDAGPSEFLTLFANAALVITNSFHGSAFSINFQRAFYTILPLRKQNNSRQRSLLEKFGLNDRLLVEGAAFPDVSTLAVDYESVNIRLEKERAKSIQFLRDAIDGK